MLSEDFDKKIRDAADHHHPAYNENAWAGMKKLLDKHLPEEKDDRRRIIFFLLLFLLLGGGAWYFFGRPAGKQNGETAASVQIAIDENRNEPVNPAAINSKKETGDVKPVANETGIADNTVQMEPAPDNSTGNPVVSIVKTKEQKGRTRAVSSVAFSVQNKKDDNYTTTTKVSVSQQPVAVKSNNDIKNDNLVNVPAPVQNDNKTTLPATGDTKISVKPAGSKAGEPAAKKINDTKKAEEKPADKNETSNAVSKKIKQSVKKKGSFFFSASAGPDISFTGNDKTGRMKFLAGAGIGYTYKEKFTLRTGFYSARKIYTSSPKNYHAPASFYTWYPNMQKIEADCRVYEIPVNFSYNFVRSGKQNFFATAGLSTYLMKKETYDYYYKYVATGPTIQKQYSYYNENNHFFSVLNLGVGYQRNLGKRVTVTAEPYFKLPLKGVGYGKVKLNSGGILFSLSIKPFQRENRK